MNLTKEQAIELAIKVMKDIDFDYDLKAEILSKYYKKEEFYHYDIWIIGFQYGLEDFGKYIRAYVEINDKTGVVNNKITMRNGSITLGYDEEKDKYFIEKKRP